MMTRRTPNMALVPAMRLEICPDDAARLLGFTIQGEDLR
jgi:hypothetical protein